MLQRRRTMRASQQRQMMRLRSARLLASQCYREMGLQNVGLLRRVRGQVGCSPCLAMGCWHWRHEQGAVVEFVHVGCCGPQPGLAHVHVNAAFVGVRHVLPQPGHAHVRVHALAGVRHVLSWPVHAHVHVHAALAGICCVLTQLSRPRHAHVHVHASLVGVRCVVTCRWGVLCPWVWRAGRVREK